MTKLEAAKKLAELVIEGTDSPYLKPGSIDAQSVALARQVLAEEPEEPEEPVRVWKCLVYPSYYAERGIMLYRFSILKEAWSNETSRPELEDIDLYHELSPAEAAEFLKQHPLPKEAKP